MVRVHMEKAFDVMHPSVRDCRSIGRIDHSILRSWYQAQPALMMVMSRSGDAETDGRDSGEKFLGHHSVDGCYEKAPTRKQEIAACHHQLKQPRAQAETQQSCWQCRGFSVEAGRNDRNTRDAWPTKRASTGDVRRLGSAESTTARHRLR